MSGPGLGAFVLYADEDLLVGRVSEDVTTMKGEVVQAGSILVMPRKPVKIVVLGYHPELADAIKKGTS